MKYSKLFSEGKIGRLSVRNRVVMTAVGVSLANYDGTPSEEMIAFYKERAKGGVGLIINEFTRIDDKTGIGAMRQLSITSDEKIPAFKKMVDAVHAEGAKMFCQLHHPGRETMCKLINDEMVIVPSVQACGLSTQTTRAMELEEIHSMIDKYINGAVRAQKAGYDGVELHGAHGYLLNQFLSPYTNHRTDVYGGSFENRLRIVAEIVQGIREKCGDYPISIRISADEFLKAVGNPAKGLELEDTIEIAKELEKLGVDAINVSAGIYETANCTIEPMSYPEGWRCYLVKGIKDAVNIPVMGIGVIRNPEFAEKLLADGNQDFIAMGRQHLADPEWTNKTKDGREKEIRKCISCLHCFESFLGAIPSGTSTECTLNPRTGYELKYNNLQKDGEGRRVAIIGAGPSGMEAARVLALRGFKPVIFEAKDKVGGQLHLAAAPPKKDKINWLIKAMEEQLKELDVEIRYNTPATIEVVSELNPYGVIIATGSEPIIPSFIKGVNQENVCTVAYILDGKVTLKGENVVVVGSGMAGLETAELLAEQGNEVTIIEMQNKIAPGAYQQNVADVKMRLDAQGVKYMTSRMLLGIEGNTLHTKKLASLKLQDMQADYIILAMGNRADTGIVKQMQEHFEHVIPVGDSTKVGRIANAIHTAFDVAYNL